MPAPWASRPYPALPSTLSFGLLPSPSAMASSGPHPPLLHLLLQPRYASRGCHLTLLLSPHLFCPSESLHVPACLCLCIQSDPSSQMRLNYPHCLHPSPLWFPAIVGTPWVCPSLLPTAKCPHWALILSSPPPPLVTLMGENTSPAPSGLLFFTAWNTGAAPTTSSTPLPPMWMLILPIY